MTYVLTLEDPARFKKSRDVGSFLGLRPRQSQSGGRDPQLGISKAGNRHLRWLLVECAHRVMSTRAPDSNLKRCGVLAPDVYDPTLNPLYRDVLRHYGAVPLPCRVADPDRKGKVESGVGHAQKTPLKGLRLLIYSLLLFIPSSDPGCQNVRLDQPALRPLQDQVVQHHGTERLSKRNMFVLLRYADGGEAKLWGFTFTLGYSRALMAEAAVDQKLGTLLKMHEEGSRSRQLRLRSPDSSRTWRIPAGRHGSKAHANFARLAGC